MSLFLSNGEHPCAVESPGGLLELPKGVKGATESAFSEGPRQLAAGPHSDY